MPPPSLFSWLREVTLFRRAFPVSTNEYALFTQYAGYKMSFQNTLNPTLQETPISGERGDEVNSVRIGEEPNLEVYKMQNILLGSGASRDFESPQTFDFHFTPSGTVERVGINYANIQGEPTSATNQGLACNNNSSEPCDPCTSVTPCSVGPINTTIPCDSLTYYSHRLSRIGGVMGANPQSIIGLTYGWTHVSADRTNTIETEKITQIPAVKGRKLEGDVIKGPGSTGGDLVKLYPVYGRNQLQIYLNIPARTNNISGYKIRIRYASKQSTDIGVELERTINPQWRRSTILATYSGDNLTYNSFSYHDVLEIDSQESAHLANLRIRKVTDYSAGTEITLDKIEFIPIEGSVEEYKADQDLEKARNAVNALFTGAAKNALKLNVTDYAVDQAANLV
ncbi:delta endotoxin C-terminal domain-containing protein [Bacillus toyonensis]|nr:delta endotoxin C-terminal domain-containing protein [Bacillus toyonensis]PFY41180.1 hypothetical protein COL55_23840 [Bacillus toyonensis]PFY81346.1 hypothetical protein COL62_11050 [Bacillus toyonensis]PHA46454.1 hypothetical protein COE68_05470 [Bacillus toyonensis]